MITILRNRDGVILSAGERDDWLPLAGQTVEVLGGTLSEYARRFQLTTDKPVIRADGLDAAEVTVVVGLQPPPPSVEVLVNGRPETIVLSGGAGTVNIRAEVAGEIAVEPADRAQFCRAGAGTVVIRAEEVV